MGKPGKKAGKGKLPPTNVNRKVDSAQTNLRDQRTIKRLKMYTSKVKRDEKGNILKGSVLSASDRVEKSMARVAPDRRWFGNTRTIGQEALQQFREEVGAKYRDPYSVVVKQSKLPLSLLEDPTDKKKKKSLLNAAGEVVASRKLMCWDTTFGDKATRKRVRLGATSVEELGTNAKENQEQYHIKKSDRALVRPRHGTDANQFGHGASGIDLSEERADKTMNRKLFKKGQSNRIWNELYKVIDSADVILYVLDARDPLGTRSPFLEEYMRKEKKYKHFVFVLNKSDLIPLWATARWLQILSKDNPTVAFHASVEHPFGKGNLISLLRQFSRLHNVSHRGSKRTKTPISIGIVGYPNVGKSSIINTLRRKSVCKVACIPGETKVWQYVALTRSIFLIDCPGIVYDKEGNNDVQAVLKGVVRVERLGSADKSDVVQTVVDIVKREDLVATYGVDNWSNGQELCMAVATKRGKLLPGGVPDTDNVARTILYDWQRGKVPWFNAPPFDTHEEYRKATDMKMQEQLKVIEHYNTFNVIDDKIHTGVLDRADGGAKERKKSAGAEMRGTQKKTQAQARAVSDDDDSEDAEEFEEGADDVLSLGSSAEDDDNDDDDEEEEEGDNTKSEEEDDDSEDHHDKKKHRTDTKQQRSQKREATAVPVPAAPINLYERETINVRNTRSGLGETIATATLLREQQEEKEKRHKARQQDAAKRGGENAKTIRNTSLKAVQKMQTEDDVWAKFVGASVGSSTKTKK